MFPFYKAFTGIHASLSVGYRFRARIHLGMKCSRELGSISSFPDGVGLYQFALAETQEMREREKNRKEKILLFQSS